MAARKAQEAPPPAQIAVLDRALAGEAPLARGYLVRGEERWFREAALSILSRSAARRGLEVARHDGADPDLDLAALQGDLSASPMFAPARLVLVRNAALLLDKEEDAEGPFTRAALAFLRGHAVPGALALETESLRVDHALAKAVAAAGGTILTLRRLYDSPPPWERDPDPRRVELVQWILARARHKGLGLDPGEAAYVAAATGNDLSALDAALDALARSGERDLRRRVGWTGAVSPFQLAEDLLRGDPGTSLAGIEALFRSGMRERDGSREVKPEALLAVLLGSLRSKLRQTLAAARAAEQGLPPDPTGNQRRREDIAQRLSLRRAESWREMLDEVAELERRTRTGRTVDASDLALLALRWRLSQVRIAAPSGKNP
jgi:DNA polymerase III delta subunit